MTRREEPSTGAKAAAIAKGLGIVGATGAALGGGTMAGMYGIHALASKLGGGPDEQMRKAFDRAEKEALRRGMKQLPPRGERELEAQKRRRSFKEIEGGGEPSRRKPPKLGVAGMDKPKPGLGDKARAYAGMAKNTAGAVADKYGPAARSYAGMAGNTAKAAGSELIQWLLKNKGKAGLAALGLTAAGYGAKKLFGDNDGDE